MEQDVQVRKTVTWTGPLVALEDQKSSVSGILPEVERAEQQLTDCVLRLHLEGQPYWWLLVRHLSTPKTSKSHRGV